MNSNPKVLMLGWELPPFNSGGLGVACHGLTKSLASQGTQIIFALPKKLPLHVTFMEIADHDLTGVELTAINSLLSPYTTAAQYQFLQADYPGAAWGSDLYAEAQRFAHTVAQWSLQKTYDLIHAHDWMTFPAALAVKHQSQKPFVAHVHATEYDRTGSHDDSRISHLEYDGLQAADRVITVSNYTKNIIHDRYAIPHDKITVVHNGLTPVHFTPTDIRRVFPHDHIVIFVGRLTFQKGVEYFLRAAQKVLPLIPNSLYLVVGDGDQFQRHLFEAAQLGISQRVIFTGFLKDEALRAVYHLAEVFVMPSVSEPYGLVALEAIAAGIPAIISKTAGVNEAVGHVTPVDFWDIDKLADTIVQSLTFPAQAIARNRCAQAEIASLTWDRAAQQTRSVYQSLCQP